MTREIKIQLLPHERAAILRANFYVGEDQGKQFAVDFFVPSEKLGTTRMPVVIGDASSAALALCAVSGAVHMNFQHIGVHDVDAVDGDFRQSEQAQELALINHRISIELKAFEWKFTEISLVEN